ncbi:NAD(P)-dependent dehydrogenase (short-subunit alcohol dehydrogenase family) [Lipingzhangella halophila]|uniref:NAD(P)-dependent dehydrogenase (Short-subunit alcohol dehydrogenase family) n=1 Tax=Lipingzhangella halophila TaxID=1783352 RepID=A0A7W7RJB1_9ACTN|nr:SDR family NAD(P)-dependent oxidoreductase [Lipingzhangella halophila]MBB4932975.1 NAD(P)-dependent dehydrogenase (short-subunit alcohol dehydrogenase family) [Lipingzhangella halophila]
MRSRDDSVSSNEPALITGATSGLGRSLAHALAERGWTVLVHGRDEKRCDQVVAELADQGATASPYVADLSSLGQTADLGRRVAAEHPSLGLLVNNAGVGFGADQQRRELSEDGYELRLAVNYLAPVLLTRTLRPALRAGGGAQVLNIGSAGQSPLDMDDPQFTRGYNGTEAYTRSKWALAAHTFMIADEYGPEGIRVNCSHPATFMDTTMVVDAGIDPWSSVAKGTESVLHAISAGEAGTTGQFFNETQRASAHPRTTDPKLRQRLSALTDDLLAPVEEHGRGAQ